MANNNNEFDLTGIHFDDEHIEATTSQAHNQPQPQAQPQAKPQVQAEQQIEKAEPAKKQRSFPGASQQQQRDSNNDSEPKQSFFKKIPKWGWVVIVIVGLIVLGKINHKNVVPVQQEINVTDRNTSLVDNNATLTLDRNLSDKNTTQADTNISVQQPQPQAAVSPVSKKPEVVLSTVPTQAAVSAANQDAMGAKTQIQVAPQPQPQVQPQAQVAQQKPVQPAKPQQQTATKNTAFNPSDFVINSPYSITYQGQKITPNQPIGDSDWAFFRANKDEKFILVFNRATDEDKKIMLQKAK